MRYYYASKGGKWTVDGERPLIVGTEAEAQYYAITGNVAPSAQAAQEGLFAMAISEQPIEQEFAQRIVGELLPALRQSYLAMVAMQVEWQDEAFQVALKKAAEAGTPLAGFSAQTWQQWGTLLLLLQTWLETPQDALGGSTPKAALMRRYIAE